MPELNPETSTPLADRPTDTSTVEWHRLSPDEALERLGVTDDGLTASVASERLAEYGTNELVDTGSSSPWKLIWEQISAVMVLILIGAAFLSLLLGKYLEAGAIGAIVILFTLLGFFQEYRAEQAIAALRKMAVPIVRVVRDGRTTEVAAGELVPGDIVQLDAGSIVPADVRLIQAANLRVEEAALTGESEPADKTTDAIDEDSLPLGDRRGMAYSGTQVTAGRGTGVVVATGMSTELGRIATLLQGVSGEDTPLQARLDKVGKQLALVGVGVAGLVVLMGAIGGEEASELVLTAISVAVAVIPEGLPAVVTFTLAIGSQRMLKRNALIRKLPAVETLGSVTVICSDKTGTLTQNQMTVTMLDVADHDILIEADATPSPEDLPATARAMLGAMVLCNDAQADTDEVGSLSLIGDPTETALLQLAANAGVDVPALRQQFSRVAENPFDSGRKRMSTVHAPLDGQTPLFAELPQDQPIAFVKGAIDGLVERASGVWSDDGPVDIDDEWRRRIIEANDRLAADGRRVLGVAYSTFGDPSVERSQGELAGEAEDELVILGLVGMIDPPRTEVRDAVAVCRRAGIRPVMITGDHPLTAKAIATELGISTDDRVLTGVDLDRLTDAEFDEAASTVSVFARVSPEHKLRIVGALQQQNQVVAMTGDGVNDAPALKRADIGVAMGITGTDVSKEASDMVLRDDNFATIVAAVEEGRVIYDNLRRFVSFAVAGNLGKIIVMLGWPIPFLIADGGSLESSIALLPLQLLWLNLMTDGLLGLSMGVEPAEQGVMERPPHSPGASLWAGGLGVRTLWIGAVIGAVSLGIGFAYESADKVEWQTMIFTTLALMQVAQAIGTRSNTESLRSIGFFTNPLLLAIAGFVTALQFLAIYTPLREFLDLETLGAVDIGICVAAGVALLVLLEIVKAFERRGRSVA
ncbi:MAG: cation-translocating P-type ATPase [Ilumatobacter sp.]|uniref:cation-translocating P-type ATPase n=1 Tax=Ilumatobacter sp. TaxID=1967498 RepID=UPI003296F361